MARDLGCEVAGLRWPSGRTFGRRGRLREFRFQGEFPRGARTRATPAVWSLTSSRLGESGSVATLAMRLIPVRDKTHIANRSLTETS